MLKFNWFVPVLNSARKTNQLAKKAENLIFSRFNVSLITNLSIG
ncbi:conserved hypothetical protein [Vibrio jasicida]|nr:hypothetical protein VCHENC03_1542 [Vibrio sp. HENC-03]CAH1540778.1 conserved hypothetical protein [Vibrio jasicida]CAH1567089.1 conserved hypothetical protein [Vibrio owensii]